MSAEEFKQRVGQLIGVSSSEREMAMEILLNKAADILEFYDAIKVRGLGIFQFKKDTEGNVDPNSVIFVPGGAASMPDKKFMYLTLKVNREGLQDTFDENIFSPGLGKKILSSDESMEKSGGPEALRKHIEDKVDEILADCDQLENFDIWENYNLASEDEVTAFDFDDEAGEKINFDEIEEEFSFDVPEVETESPKIDIAEESNQIEDDISFGNFEFEEEGESDEPKEDNVIFDEDEVQAKGEYLRSSIDIDFDFDTLKSAGEKEQEAPDNITEEPEEPVTRFEAVSPEDMFADDNEEEIDDDWFTLDDNETESDESVIPEEEPKLEEREEDISVDEEAWDWGEEPVEEFEEKTPHETEKQTEKFHPAEHDDEENLFQTLEREIEVIKEEPVEENEEDLFSDELDEGVKNKDEFNLPPIIEIKETEESTALTGENQSFIPPKEDEEKDEVSGDEATFDKKTWEEIYKDFDFDDVKKGSKKDEIKKLKEKTLGNKMFSRNMIIILAVMLLLVSVVTYFFIFAGDETPIVPEQSETEMTSGDEKDSGEPVNDVVPEEVVDAKLDNLLAEQENNKTPVEENKAEQEPPAGNKQELPPVKEVTQAEAPTGMYLDFASGEQVKNLIFRLNGNYYVQVASVPSSAGAEKEAQRLRKIGRNAYISKVYITSKKATYYRVKAGPFGTMKEAEDYLARN